MPPRCARGSGRYHKKSGTCKQPCPKLHSKGWRRKSKEPYACYRTKPHVIAGMRDMFAAGKIRASLRKKVERSRAPTRPKSKREKSLPAHFSAYEMGPIGPSQKKKKKTGA